MRRYYGKQKYYYNTGWIIVVLAAIIGFAVLNPMHAKEPTKIKITSNKTLTEEDSFSLQLTDLNKTALSKQKVNITVKNSKGKVVLNKTVKTNDKGKAKLNLDLKKGKYNVTVSYDGNENYTGDNKTQKLTIKEKERVVEEPATQESTQSSSSSDELYYDAEINVYYNSEGITVDPDGEHWHGAGYRYEDLRDARDRWERGEQVMV